LRETFAAQEPSIASGGGATMCKRYAWIFGTALALATVTPTVRSQEQQVVIRHTFEETDGGWSTLSMGGKVKITRDVGDPRVGKAALQFDYTLGKGSFDALILPTPDSILGKAKSFRFWLKANTATTAVVSLTERGEGRYNTPIYLPKDTWQRVELSASDFVLGDGKEDPKDPNNHLDLEKVESIAIVDFGVFFVQSDDPLVATLFGVKPGPRTLYLADFVVSSEELPETISSVNGEVRLDKFIRPHLSWVGVGGVQLSRFEGKPLDGPGLRVDYQQAPGKIVAIARGFRPGTMIQTQVLSFNVASAKAAMLLVELEEVGGGKYYSSIQVPGGSALQHIALKFVEFKKSYGSLDSNDRLDPDQVKSIVIRDATGDTSTTATENTLWINRLRASPGT
jgi:hypothetical protein